MNPFSLMRRVTQELDRVLSESTGREQGDRAWSPAIEVTQREGNYLIRAELPGVTPDAIKLEVTDDAIVIQGETRAEHEETRGDIHVTERRYGAFYRAIPLPEGAKPDEARARYENGVLEITVPTEEQGSRRREIPIQQGSETKTGTPAGNPGASSESATGSGKAA
jgi:HSP20 family protein